MPTALELGPKGWKTYTEAFIRRRAFAGTKSIEIEERERLLDQVRELATILKERFGAKRVVLFGSMAQEDWFSPDSDIDLAVEGLRPEHYWKAWEALEEEIRDRPVDLIAIESASEPLRKSIDRYGVEL
jgi:uncharacterized protein